MRPSFSVLFVCLGNICRSPMAEAAFNVEVNKRKLNIRVDSAGLGPWHVNDPPDPRTIKEVARHGIDIRHYVGRQVHPDDFLNFTHLIGMDHKNITHLRKLAPLQYEDKISLFLDYTQEYKGQTVADPYYGDQSDFENTWKQVSLGASSLADYFEKKL